MAEQKSSQQVAHESPEKAQQQLPQPLRAAVSVLGKVPGAGTVGRVAEGTLDRVAAVSPRGRRLAVYAGAGVLGVAGIVEWPVAVTGAAVAWLTQPRPGERESHGGAGGPQGAGDFGDSAGDFGDSEDTGDRPTPRVLASTHGMPSSGASGAPSRSAADGPGGAMVASSPSDKLPVHETAPPSGPRGAARGSAGDRR
ncbi:hypothetical protein ABZ307_01685 [Streptomyces griseorubiginosus]|uniref:hypothetical protein n=1 Tax=Streptomyces griseorubiginosus TaxID=67304 RepID=UPI0033A8A9CE